MLIGKYTALQLYTVMILKKKIRNWVALAAFDILKNIEDCVLFGW
jgi:hypothetical protein